jgi:hypothetical protein
MVGDQQDKPSGKVKPENRKGSRASSEGSIACKRVKVTLSDHLRLGFAEAAKYSDDLEQAVRRRDVLRAVTPKGKHNQELYQLERQIRRRQKNDSFRHRKMLLAGLDGPGRPKSFYRLALEYDSSLTPKQYLHDDNRGRYLTKRQRVIVMKKLEKIRASFLRSFRNNGHQVKRSFSLERVER